jgi:hypothetical protein
VFTDAAGSDALADALAAEVGSRVQVIELRLESLGGASSWHDVLRADAEAIVEALR